MLRWLIPGGEGELGGLPEPGIGFNYLGQLDQALPETSPFRPAAEPAGAPVSPRGMRGHLLEVNASISAGRLRVNWTYSSEIHRRETVEQLAGEYLAALRGLIAHCQSPTAGGVSVSDFPLAELASDELENALLELDFEERAF
jgi:non-ribosomal peptide synthase protein (TIGR01720 family)